MFSQQMKKKREKWRKHLTNSPSKDIVKIFSPQKASTYPRVGCSHSYDFVAIINDGPLENSVLQCISFYFLHLFTCVHVHTLTLEHSDYMEVKGQLAGVSSLLPCEPRGSNSGRLGGKRLYPPGHLTDLHYLPYFYTDTLSGNLTELYNEL